MTQNQTTPTPASPIVPLALLLALSSLWALSPAVTKFLALEGRPPSGIVFWQTLIAGTGLLVMCKLRRVEIGLSRQHLLYYGVMGVFGLAIPNANMVFAVAHIPAGLMSVIIVTAPVITYVLAVAIRLERFAWLRGGGVALGFAGVCLLVVPRGSLPSPDMLPYVLLALITPLGWAVTNVFAEVARPKDTDSMSLAMGTMYVAAAASLVSTLATGSFHPLWQDMDIADQVIIAYGLVTVMTFFLYFTLVTMAGAVYLGQVGYLTTLMGLGWGALFYGERPSAWVWLAVATVFAGVAMVNMGKRKPEPASGD